MSGSPAALVRAFHDAYGVTSRVEPVADIPEAALRRALLEEEWREYDRAEVAGDLVEIADGLADVVYVAYGTALAHGIDLDAVLAEVHRSNMSKSKPDAGGKGVKGPGYFPPDIAAALRPPMCWCGISRVGATDLGIEHKRSPDECVPADTLRARHERGEWLSDDELAALARGKDYLHG